MRENKNLIHPIYSFILLNTRYSVLSNKTFIPVHNFDKIPVVEITSVNRSLVINLCYIHLYYVLSIFRYLFSAPLFLFTTQLGKLNLFRVEDYVITVRTCYYFSEGQKPLIILKREKKSSDFLQTMVLVALRFFS